MPPAAEGGDVDRPRQNERRLHAEANALPQVRFGSSAENVAILVAAAESWAKEKC